MWRKRCHTVHLKVTCAPPPHACCIQGGSARPPLARELLHCPLAGLHAWSKRQHTVSRAGEGIPTRHSRGQQCTRHGHQARSAFASPACGTARGQAALRPRVRTTAFTAGKPKQLMFRMPACDGGHQRMFSGQRGLRLDMHTAPRYHMSNSLLCEMCAEPHTETAPYSPCWHRRSDTLYNLRVARAPLSVLNMWAARAAPRKCLINGRHNVRPSCM